MKASPGRLIQSSVTSGFARSGLKDRSVSCRADASTALFVAGGDGTEFIDGPEIQIAGDQHLNSIAVLFHYRGRNIDRAFEYLGHDPGRGGGVHDDGAVSGVTHPRFDE